MIRRIYSSLPTFKSLRLKPGLNVLLATKTDNSTDKQTRNRAGKTSLIELIHFLFGASLDDGSIFRAPETIQHEFGMEVDLAGSLIDVRRSGGQPGKVRLTVLNGELAFRRGEVWRAGTTYDLSAKEWLWLAGYAMFGVEDPEDSKQSSFRPTFRSLFGYFVRRPNEGGFIQPMRALEKQQPWNQYVSVAFLLGLDWTIPQDAQLVNERAKGIQRLRRAAGKELKEIIGNTARLRAQVQIEEGRVVRLRRSISSFRVHEQYEELAREADRLTREYQELANLNTTEAKTVGDLERAIAREAPPEIQDLKLIYEQAGVALPSVALKRFDEVREFHESVIENRRSYLQGELAGARLRITERERRLEAIDQRRGELLDLLRSHGALEHLTAMQLELGRMESQADTLRRRFSIAVELDDTKNEVEIRRAELQRRIRQDMTERAPVLRHAVAMVAEVTEELYGTPGQLLIDAKPNGVHLNIQVEGDRSVGIKSMEIFCFDLMLIRLAQQRRLGPGFLVHDSHLFDPVDPRQRAAALQVAKSAALQHGFQYLVTLNSDQFPTRDDSPEEFDGDADILGVQLTDETDTGGIFGVRLSVPPVP